MSTKSRRRSVFLSLATAAVGTAIGLSEPARAATDIWTNQAGTGNWSTSATDKNWSILGVQSAFTNGDNVVFNDSAGAGNTSVDLVGTLLPANVTVADPTLNFTFFGSGSLGNNGANLTKSGGGTLTLANSTTNQYSGTTSVEAGTLTINLANLPSATNLVGGSVPDLFMYGGTLNLTDGPTNGSQLFLGAGFQAGASSVFVGGASVDRLNLQSLGRLQGGTVDFSVEAPFPGANFEVLTSAGNAYGTGLHAMVGGYATFGGGATWAQISGGQVAAMSPAGYSPNTWLPGDNTDVTGPMPPATGPTQSLRFNVPGSFNVLVNPGAVITSGGILVTPNTIGPDALLGGTLTSGNTENDLIINQYGPAAPLIMATTIVNNGANLTGLTKSGPGTAILANTNSYTGPTVINGGILSTGALAVGGSPSNIGASTNVAANLVLNGGTLQFSGASAGSTDRVFSVGPNGGTLDGSGTTPLNFNNSLVIAYPEDAPTTLTLTGSYGTPSAGNLLSLSMGDPDVAGTFKASVVKNGTGTWIMTNSSNTYTGGTTINAGILKVQDTLSATSSSLGTGPVTVNNGGTLGGDGALQSSVYGPTTVNAGGSIVPGDATQLIFQNGLTLDPGAELTYTLNTAGIPNQGPTGGNDQISARPATISTNLSVSVNPGASFGTGTYPLLKYLGLTNNSSGFSGWSVDMLSAPPGLGAGQYQTYTFSNDITNSSVDLNVAVTNTVPTLPSGGSTTIVQQANTAINNSTFNSPIVKILGGAGGNTGAGGGANTAFYLARGPQAGAKAFSFGWIPLAFQLAPGTPYFVSSGIQVGDPNQTGIPVSPNAPYTTNAPFNPAGTGQVSIGGNVVGAVYPAGTNPPSAAPDDWLPAFYLAPLIVMSDPPATPVPTYYGESFANPNGLSDIYLADQVGGEDELPSMLDADAAGADDEFNYQGSFLSLVQSDFPSITDLSQLSDAQWSKFDGSYGVDPFNHVAWSVDDLPNADFTVIGILPEPGSLSLLGLASAGLLARRRRAKKVQ